MIRQQAVVGLGRAAPLSLARCRLHRPRGPGSTRTIVRCAANNSKSGGTSFGNVNRLAAADEINICNGISNSFDDAAAEDAEAERRLGSLVARGKRMEEWKERLLYKYFCWRQDTWSDLQLFGAFNVFLLLAGGILEGSIVRQLDPPDPEEAVQGPGWWTNLYSVMVWMLGEDLPRAYGSGIASQVFAVLTVATGLVSFALVLALVEQVVLEVLESNVKRGSQVFEEDHLVVLAWCESAYDLSQLTRVLGQACYAFSGQGGGVVVVLTQNREKLEMESIYRKALPEEKRLGTQFVFRQGSPLDPESLLMVAATKARAVIISADGARSAHDSDGQCLRTAVLLDELVDAEPPGRKGPTIVMQVQDPDSLTTVRYACSNRVLPVVAHRLKARRIARIVRSPIVAVISNLLTDFRSDAHISVHEYPELVGVPFGKLHFYFPRAIVYGLVTALGRTKLNPSPQRAVRAGEQIFMLRPGPVGDCPAARPLSQPVEVSIGSWDPSSYTMVSQDEEPLGVDITEADERCLRQHSEYCQFGGKALDGEGEDDDDGPQMPRPWVVQGQRRQGSGVFVLPLQYSSPLVQATDLLICGWGRSAFMWSLLQELDHGPQALPPGASVTLLNDHPIPEGIEEACRCNARGITNLNIKHVQADPRSLLDLRSTINIADYKAVIVLADTFWNSKGQGEEFHTYSVTQEDMLRMDASVLLVQLHIRALLEEQGLPDISIVVQRQTMVGNTRFEDATKLPLGLPINPSSFIGKVLTQMAFDPRFMGPYQELGAQSDLVVQDSSAFAAPGEELSFLELQARAVSVQQVLLGYYRIPKSGDEPIEVVVNPLGLEKRAAKQVFNQGDSRCKLVTMAPNGTIKSAQTMRSIKALSGAASSGSNGSDTEGPPTIDVLPPAFVSGGS